MEREAVWGLVTCGLNSIFPLILQHLPRETVMAHFPLPKPPNYSRHHATYANHYFVCPVGLRSRAVYLNTEQVRAGRAEQVGGESSTSMMPLRRVLSCSVLSCAVLSCSVLFCEIAATWWACKLLGMMRQACSCLAPPALESKGCRMFCSGVLSCPVL